MHKTSVLLTTHTHTHTHTHAPEQPPSWLSRPLAATVPFSPAKKREFICATWLIHMCDRTHCFVGATWLNHMCDMTKSSVRHTHSYVRQDSFVGAAWLTHLICARLLVHLCNMTHSYVWHDSFVRATWLIHTCDVTPSYVRQDSFVGAARFCINMYGVATISRLRKIIGLFCRLLSIW